MSIANETQILLNATVAELQKELISLNNLAPVLKTPAYLGEDVGFAEANTKVNIIVGLLSQIKTLHLTLTN